MLLNRLGAHDRALFHKVLLSRTNSRVWRRIAVALTHLGGARVSIALASWPLLLEGRWQGLGEHALATLALSHVLVQIVKRSVSRARPSCGELVECLVDEPDRFSFPSGHAAASFAVALSFATVLPGVAVPVIVIAGAVGASRVVLGVHYPGDVAVGQTLALATHFALIRAGV
ncbi:MAG: phosphatase PAP2 family protein [bacterium]